MVIQNKDYTMGGPPTTALAVSQDRGAAIGCRTSEAATTAETSHWSIPKETKRGDGLPMNTITFEGNQWSEGSTPVSVDEIEYFLSRCSKGTNIEDESDEESQVYDPSCEVLSEEERGTFLELPNNNQKCELCNMVYNTIRLLSKHMQIIHGMEKIMYRCRQCRCTFDRVHRLECHVPKCKTGNRTKTKTSHPFQCAHCSESFRSKSGLSQHERHRHPAVANERRKGAKKKAVEAKRQKRREKRPTAKKWDDISQGIFVSLLKQLGDVKGLHAKVQSELQTEGYEFTLAQIRSRKQTKAFQTALGVETIASQTATSQTPLLEMTNTTKSGEGQTYVPKVTGELFNDLSMEQVALALEDTEMETNAKMATILRNTLAAANQGPNAQPEGCMSETYEEHEELLNEYLEMLHESEDDSIARRKRKGKPTRIKTLRRKKLRGKPKERAEKFRSIQQSWNANRKAAVKQILDGASDAKCQIPAKEIEKVYKDRFETVGPTVDLGSDPGPYNTPASIRNCPPTPEAGFRFDSRDETNQDEDCTNESEAAAGCGSVLDAISTTEVRAAVRTLKRGTACGPDRLTAEAIKRKVGPKVEFLTGAFNIWLMTGKIPEHLKASRSILLAKTTDRLGEIGNWRPLSISSVILRIYTKILAKRLTAGVTLHPSQRGFIPAPGVEQNSVLLEHLIRQQKKTKGTLAVVFLDLAKAFDTVSHDLIAKGLERLSVPKQFRNIVSDLYQNATTSFRAVDGETEEIQILRGVKQGDPLSPILFNICMDPLFCRLERDG